MPKWNWEKMRPKHVVELNWERREKSLEYKLIDGNEIINYRQAWNQCNNSIREKIKR